MKKIIGWTLFLLSIFLIFDTVYALTSFFFAEFGFWIGLLNFTLLPLTYFVHPLLRLFYAGTLEDIIYNFFILGMFWTGWKLLSRNVKRIPKQTKISIDEKDIPNLTRFELFTSLASVPFSYYVLLFGTGLTTALGILLAGGLYYLEASLTNRVHVGIIFLIGLGVLYALFVGIYSIYVSLKKSKRFEIAFLLKDEGSPIFGLVDEVASKVGVKAPDNILISFQPDFHVHQVSTTLIDGTKVRGRTLTIGLVFLKYLTASEIEAIIAHEMAHFKGRDTLFSIYVAPAYKSLKTALVNLYELTTGDEETNSKSSSNKGWMALPNLLTVFIFTKYFYSFQKMISSLDRIREARADIIASVIYGSNIFGSALQKVAQLGPIFKEASQKNFITIITEHNKVFNNYFDFFNDNLYDKKDIKKLMQNISDADSITSELDTHFSLKARVAYLPSDNDKEDNNKPVLGKKDLVGYEEKLTEMYGAYISILTGALNKQEKTETSK